MNAPLAKPERGACTSLSKAPAPRRDNLSLLQLFLPTPVTVRRLFIARGPSESQLGSSSHHVHISEPHVHLPNSFQEHPPPAPLGLRVADAPWSHAQGLGERGTSARAPFTYNHQLNEPRSPFPSAAVPKQGLSPPREAGAGRRPPISTAGSGWGCKWGAPGTRRSWP